MGKIVSLFIVALFVTVAALAYADQPLPKPDVMNVETIMATQRLSGYDTIVIKDFSTDGAVYDRIDDEEKPKVEALKPLIVKTLTLSIEAELKKRKLFKNVVLNSDIQENAIILEGNFTEFMAEAVPSDSGSGSAPARRT